MVDRLTEQIQSEVAKQSFHIVNKEHALDILETYHVLEFGEVDVVRDSGVQHNCLNFLAEKLSYRQSKLTKMLEGRNLSLELKLAIYGLILKRITCKLERKHGDNKYLKEARLLHKEMMEYGGAVEQESENDNSDSGTDSD